MSFPARRSAASPYAAGVKAIRLTALVGDQKLGPYAVEASGEVMLGRAAVQGLHLPEDWAPRVLATLVPTEHCWLVINGGSARCRVSNEWLDCDLPAQAVFAIPDGETRVRWPSAHDHLVVKLNVGGPVDPGMPRLHPELDDVDERLGRMERTEWFPERGSRVPEHFLQPRQRRAMAHVFRHLLEETPRPSNLYKRAASELGVSEDALRKQTRRVRERVNRERFQKLRALDDLGEYLVQKARLVTAADLLDTQPNPPGASAASVRHKRRVSPR